MIELKECSSLKWFGLFVLLVSSLDITPIRGHEVNRARVNIAELPPPFSDDKLASQPQETAVDCLEHLGCIERLPGLSDSIESIGTEISFEIMNRKNSNEGDVTKIKFETMENCVGQSECGIFPFNLDSILSSGFDPSLKTIMIIPGVASRHTLELLSIVQQRWLELQDVNSIMVQWRVAEKDDFITAALKAKVISRQIVVFLYYLASLNGLDFIDQLFLKNIHLVGHAMGSHIAGYIGRDLGGRVDRITALDPTGKFFDKLPVDFRLHKSNSLFVDVIHTSSGKGFFAGTDISLGHIDYFANDGHHQPACTDPFGDCDQRMAIEYYDSLLLHEIHGRGILKEAYHSRDRLFAVAAKNFNEFHNGLSLMERCPVTILYDNEPHMKDINNCIAPMDPVTSAFKLREELRRKHGINPDAPSEDQQRYYFYTRSLEHLLCNQYTLRIRVRKPNARPEKRADVTSNEVCDISIDISMSGRDVFNHKLESYKLIDRNDFYEIIAPYPSGSHSAKYSLAESDAYDYYAEELDPKAKLLPKMADIFPSDILIQGLKKDDKTAPKSLFESIFGSIPASPIRKNSGNNECDLTIETVQIQPLKQLIRRIAAYYSYDSRADSDIELIILKDGDETSRVDPLRGRQKDDHDYDNGKSRQRIFLSTVIIGPPEKVVDDTCTDSDSCIIGEHAEMKTESSIVSVSTWVLSSIIALCLAIVLAMLLWRKVVPSSNKNEDTKVLELAEDENEIH